jgi:outer membrane receptor protein involved in Fe transport
VLTSQQVKEVPALFGEIDVMKSLQRLPGVQSGGDGTAGIFVRGGNYDQNLITLDGSTLYNGEHLKGFVSAINAEMVDNVVLYKGAFPARYGSRLSSVIDIGVREGDFESYHGSASIGMLSTKVQAEGPIWKGRTSFNVAARASYFDAIVQPLLKSVYDNKKAMEPYAKMNFYDVNAKLVHRFSESDRLSAVFYWGKDVSNSSPTDSETKFESKSGEIRTKKNETKNNWGNLVSSLYWTHTAGDRFLVNVNASFSLYDYRLAQNVSGYYESRKMVQIQRLTEDVSETRYDSKVKDASITADFRFRPVAAHDLRWGVKGSLQQLSPIIHAYSYNYDYTPSKVTRTETDRTIGERQDLLTASIYAEDDWTVAPWLMANVGLRYSLFSVENKTYGSLEPRASVRFLLTPAMALKLSYARMAQGVHLLSSSNIVMPSDIWVPVTEKIPLMRSNQYAGGVNYEIMKGLEVSVEGYYKTMDNVLEYNNGASWLNCTGDWQSLVSLGKGRSYGVELMAQRSVGNTTGWVSYTWAKSLRTFDRPGQELNGGREFLAGNDKRHNFNIVVVQRLGQHWKLSASWTYQSGRRGILANTSMYGGVLQEWDPSFRPESSTLKEQEYMQNRDDAAHWAEMPGMFTTYRERNNYKLPDVHHLDVGITYSVNHRGFGASEVNLSFYNLYNQKNINSVYIGTNNKKYVLKGICMFPFMPSLTYTLKF